MQVQTKSMQLKILQQYCGNIAILLQYYNIAAILLQYFVPYGKFGGESPKNEERSRKLRSFSRNFRLKLHVATAMILETSRQTHKIDQTSLE